MVIRAFSDFKAFLYILIGGFRKPPIKIYKKALKSEKARITDMEVVAIRNLVVLPFG